MSRLSFDALILQSKIASDESLTIDHIATVIFGIEGEDGKPVMTKTSRARAVRAAMNLITMKRAVPFPDRQNMTAIRSAASNGVQAESIMNMVVRGGVDRRKEDRGGGRRATDKVTETAE